VRCAKCGTNNPSTNNFCAKCGNALAKHCPKCQAENPPTSDFCGKCGTRLTDGPNAAVATSSPQGSAPNFRVTPEQPDGSTALDGERKTVTALFADIKGSNLIENLEAAQARSIIEAPRRLRRRTEPIESLTLYLQSFCLANIKRKVTRNRRMDIFSRCAAPAAVSSAVLR
jgi:ribosomal protein L40E